MNDYDIAEIFKAMELHLIASMRRNLGRHLTEELAEGFDWKAWQAEKLKELKRYQRENKSIIKAYTKGLPKDITKILMDEFKQGNRHEINRYNKLFDKKMSDSFFKLDDRKVKALIEVVNNDLNKGETACLRMINDQYRQTIHRAAMFANTGVMTSKQAVDMATKEFLSRGLNVIEYKNGRRVNIAEYSQMAVRTASQRAMLMGEAEFRKEIGENLIIISRHGTACKLCRPFESKIFIDDVYANGKPDGIHNLLSVAMTKGLFHPNCRHGVNTYYDLKGIDEAAPIDKVPVDNDDPEVSRIDVDMRKQQRFIEGCQDEGNVAKARAKLNELEVKKESIIFTPEKNNVSFNDVTEEWLKEISNEDGTLEDQYFFIDKNNKKYEVDDVNVILDHSKNEEKIAEWYAKQKKINIKMLPRVMSPQDIKSGDFIEETTGVVWEIKEPEGNTIGTTMLNQFKRQKEKAHKFIIDMHKSDMDMDVAVKEIETILSNRRYDWVEEVVLMKNGEVKKVFKR